VDGVPQDTLHLLRSTFEGEGKIQELLRDVPQRVMPRQFHLHKGKARVSAVRRGRAGSRREYSVSFPRSPMSFFTSRYIRFSTKERSVHVRDDRFEFRLLVKRPTGGIVALGSKHLKEYLFSDVTK